MRRSVSAVCHRVCDSEATASSRGNADSTFRPGTRVGSRLYRARRDCVPGGNAHGPRAHSGILLVLSARRLGQAKRRSRTESRREEENGRRDLVRPRPNQATLNTLWTGEPPDPASTITVRQPYRQTTSGRTRFSPALPASAKRRYVHTILVVGPTLLPNLPVRTAPTPRALVPFSLSKETLVFAHSQALKAPDRHGGG